jgi:hypothetical protein
VSPLEKLFRLEIEFHRRLRAAVPGTFDAGGLHASFALQTCYERLIGSVGAVTAADIDRVRQRLFLTSDPRDVLAARGFLLQLLNINSATREPVAALHLR